MAKRYNKDFFKELKSKSEKYYDSIPALNWGATKDDKYVIDDRYHFTWKIQNPSGHLVPLENDVFTHIKKFKETTDNKSEEIGIPRSIKAYIGADSQNYLSFTRFVCTIVLHVEKNGAHVIVSRFDLPKIYDYRYKLLREIDMLGEIARNFKDFFASVDMDLELHGDLNKSSNHKSNGVVEEATNYISHLGFNLKIKNESFAATYAADHFCK
jgi:predicted RNase H-related nuclease YkuK (DUF458 family)